MTWIRWCYADHGGHITPCRHKLDIEDEDDPMKADWGLWTQHHMSILCDAGTSQPKLDSTSEFVPEQAGCHGSLLPCIQGWHSTFIRNCYKLGLSLQKLRHRRFWKHFAEMLLNLTSLLVSINGSTVTTFNWCVFISWWWFFCLSVFACNVTRDANQSAVSNMCTFCWWQTLVEVTAAPHGPVVRKMSVHGGAWVLGKNNHVAKKTVLSHIPDINAYNQNEGQCIKTEMIQSHYNLTSTVLH